MLLFRPLVSITRGSTGITQTYNTPQVVPIVNLLPYEDLDIEYEIRYNIFLVPQINREIEATVFVRYFNATTAKPFASLELVQNDWEEQGFKEGDEVAIYMTEAPNAPAHYMIYGIVDQIKGNTMNIHMFASFNNPSAKNLLAFVTVLDTERRGRPGVLPTRFISLLRRQGDVSGEISPLSDLLYAEPHADGILIVSESHSIESVPVILQGLPLTGIYEPGYGDMIVRAFIQLNTWSGIPSSKKPPFHFRVAKRKIKIANFFSYRAEYNTLARQAQRDLYHENADLITKLVLNSDERELSIPLRLRLLHANVDSEGKDIPLNDITVPNINEGLGLYLSSLYYDHTKYTLLGAHYALTTDNNEHHRSTLIRHQHDLTRFTNATGIIVFPVSLTTSLALSSVPATALSNDLRRNPFETYVVALWKFQRNSTGEELVVCSNTLHVDIDDGIQKQISWLNDSGLNYPYGRFDTFVLSWTETEEPEKGEYTVYVLARKDQNSPSYVVEKYTFKVDESTRTINIPPSQEFYSLHYAHKYTILLSPNTYIVGNVDTVITQNSPTNYNVRMCVPVPAFDLPTVRTPVIRPETGSLFDWFRAFGSNVITIPSGSIGFSKPVQVSDADVRIFVYTPTGKLYATPWRKVRAREKTNTTNNHHVTITESASLVVVAFPIASSQPQTIKSTLRIFNENISSLKPFAEAAFDPLATYTTNTNHIFPSNGFFFGGRFFIIFKDNLPEGRYKLHVLANYKETGATQDVGYDGYFDDLDYSFIVGSKSQIHKGIERPECCYEPPVIKGETIKYIVFDSGTNTYSQQSIVIPTNPVGTAWQQFVNTYECCFKIYDNNSILKSNFVDVIAIFDNRINKLSVSGEHWFRYRGFITKDSDEITTESYTRADLSEEFVYRTFRRRYTLELFLTDCDIKALDFQKLARMWKILNYTNSLVDPVIECIVQNIELTTQYNKLKATIMLIEAKPDEYRHK